MAHVSSGEHPMAWSRPWAVNTPIVVPGQRTSTLQGGFARLRRADRGPPACDRAGARGARAGSAPHAADTTTTSGLSSSTPGPSSSALAPPERAICTRFARQVIAG